MRERLRASIGIDTSGQRNSTAAIALTFCRSASPRQNLGVTLAAPFVQWGNAREIRRQAAREVLEANEKSVTTQGMGAVWALSTKSWAH